MIKTLTFLIFFIVTLQSVNLISLRENIIKDNQVKEYGFTLTNLVVSPITENFFSLVGDSDFPKGTKASIKFTSNQETITREMKLLNENILLSSLIPSTNSNPATEKLMILQGFTQFTNMGIDIDVEIDFSSLPRSIQKFVPFQKVHIKGKISKKADKEELSSTEISFRIFALFKNLVLFGKVVLKDPKFTIAVEKKQSTKVTYLEIDSDVLFKFNPEPLNINLKGVVENGILSLQGKTNEEWKNPFGLLPKVVIKEISSQLEISLENPTYFLLKGNMHIFSRKLQVVAEIGDQFAYITANIDQLEMKEVSEFSQNFEGGSSVTNLLEKMPISINIKKSKITLSNTSGAGRSGNSVKKGFTLETVSDIELFEIAKLNNVVCKFGINGTGFESQCTVDQNFKLGPLTIKKTTLGLKVLKSHQALSLESVTNVFNISDLDIHAKIARINGKVEFGFSAKPVSFSLSRFKGFPIGIYEKLNLGVPQIYYTTHDELFESRFKIPKGVNIRANIDLTKNGQFFERIYNITGLKELGFYAQLGEALNGEVSLDKIKLGAYVDLRIKPSKYFETGPLSLDLGIEPLSCSFKGSVYIIIPRTQERLKFTGEFALKPTGTLEIHASLEAKWNPFGFKFIEINAAALALGINPATFAVTGMPSMIGAAGKFQWKTVGDISFGLLIDTVDAGHSLIHAKADKISTDNILSLLNLNITKRIPDIALNNLLIHIAPLGGRIGEITFEKGFVVQGQLTVMGKTIVSAKVSIESSGFTGSAQITDIKFGNYLALNNVKFSVALSASNQHISFSGVLIILKIQKSIMLEASVDYFKFETSLVSPQFSYLILAISEGGLINPTDFMVEVKWDIAMIRKFEDIIRRLLRSKIGNFNRLKQMVNNIKGKITQILGKIGELGRRFRNLVCSVITPLCRQLRIDIEREEKLLKEERLLLKSIEDELNKIPAISPFVQKNAEKFTISRGHFKIRLSKMVSTTETENVEEIEFDTNCDNQSKNIRSTMNIENPFNLQNEEGFINQIIKNY